MNKIKNIGLITLLAIFTMSTTGCNGIGEETETEDVLNDKKNFTVYTEINAGANYKVQGYSNNSTGSQLNIGYVTYNEVAENSLYGEYFAYLGDKSMGMFTYSDISDLNNTQIYYSADGSNWVKSSINLNDAISKLNEVFGLNITDIASFTSDIDNFDFSGIEIPDIPVEVGTDNKFTYTIDGGSLCEALAGTEIPVEIGYDSETKVPTSIDIDLSDECKILTEAYSPKDGNNLVEFNYFTIHTEYSNIGNTEVTVPDNIENAQEQSDLINWQAYGVDPDNWAESTHVNQYLDLLGLGDMKSWFN